MNNQTTDTQMHEPQPPDLGRATEAAFKQAVRELEEAENSMNAHIKNYGYMGDSVGFNLKRMLVSKAQRRVLSLAKLHFGSPPQRR